MAPSLSAIATACARVRAPSGSGSLRSWTEQARKVCAADAPPLDKAQSAGKAARTDREVHAAEQQFADAVAAYSRDLAAIPHPPDPRIASYLSGWHRLARDSQAVHDAGIAGKRALALRAAKRMSARLPALQKLETELSACP